MDASTTTRAGYGQPALIGGLVMGVLSALPLIGAANFCCCFWVVSGGVTAAYLLQQTQSAPITAGDGAVVGLLAGLIGAVVTSLLLIPIGMLVEPVVQGIAERTLQMPGNIPPQVRQMLERLSEPRADIGIVAEVVAQILLLFFFFFVGAIFSTLGGLLGVALFRKRAAPPDVQPA